MRRFAALLLIAVASLSHAVRNGWIDSLPVNPPTPPVVVEPTEKATAATYVYLKGGPVAPGAVQAGLNRLNRERKIVATIHEVDTLDGDEQEPDQYKVPAAAAKQAGLPALVVTAGVKVLNVVKSPTTAEQVVGAVP